jgi:hypothetical protein
LFNAAVDNVENSYGEIGMLLFFQLIAHADEVDFGVLPEDKAGLVEKVLSSLSIENVHLNFAFTIKSSEIEQTAEAKRQRLLTMVQLYSLYGEKMLALVQGELALAMQAGDKQTAGVMLEKYKEFSNTFIVGSTKIMDEVLKEMSQDRTGLLPYVKDFEMLLAAMKAMKDQSLGGGGENGIRQFTGGNQEGPAPGGLGGAESGMGGPGEQEGLGAASGEFPGAGG